MKFDLQIMHLHLKKTKRSYKANFMRVKKSLHVYDVDQRLVSSHFGYTPEPNGPIDRAASYSCYEPNPNQKNPIMHFI